MWYASAPCVCNTVCLVWNRIYIKNCSVFSNLTHQSQWIFWYWLSLLEEILSPFLLFLCNKRSGIFAVEGTANLIVLWQMHCNFLQIWSFQFHGLCITPWFWYMLELRFFWDMDWLLYLLNTKWDMACILV